jgi:4-aminobutyrate aminotransferase-like enzyme
VLPISAFLASRDVMSVFRPGDHGSTFGGNPLACAVARAALSVLVDEALPARAAELGAEFQERLRAIRSRHIREVRGRGLMIGVELVKDRATKERATELRNELVMDAFHRGGMVILGAGQNTIRFCPALTLTEDEARLAVDIFARSLNALTGVSHG